MEYGLLSERDRHHLSRSQYVREYLNDNEALKYGTTADPHTSTAQPEQYTRPLSLESALSRPTIWTHSMVRTPCAADPYHWRNFKYRSCVACKAVSPMGHQIEGMILMYVISEVHCTLTRGSRRFEFVALVTRQH